MCVCQSVADTRCLKTARIEELTLIICDIHFIFSMYSGILHQWKVSVRRPGAPRLCVSIVAHMPGFVSYASLSWNVMRRQIGGVDSRH